MRLTVQGSEQPPLMFLNHHSAALTKGGGEGQVGTVAMQRNCEMLIYLLRSRFQTMCTCFDTRDRMETQTCGPILFQSIAFRAGPSRRSQRWRGWRPRGRLQTSSPCRPGSLAAFASGPVHTLSRCLLIVWLVHNSLVHCLIGCIDTLHRGFLLSSFEGLKLTHAVVLSKENVDMSNILLHGIICRLFLIWFPEYTDGLDQNDKQQSLRHPGIRWQIYERITYS